MKADVFGKELLKKAGVSVYNVLQISVMNIALRNAVQKSSLVGSYPYWLI